MSGAPKKQRKATHAPSHPASPEPEPEPDLSLGPRPTATVPVLPDLRYDAQGLVAAVVQDADTGAVLMLGWMDREALGATLETGEVHFHSRSRGVLWRKGETSGNVLRLVSVAADCDGDALLVLARPAGPTCHTGETSCFHREVQVTGDRGPGTGKAGSSTADLTQEAPPQRPSLLASPRSIPGGDLVDELEAVKKERHPERSEGSRGAARSARNCAPSATGFLVTALRAAPRNDSVVGSALRGARSAEGAPDNVAISTDLREIASSSAVPAAPRTPRNDGKDEESASPAGSWLEGLTLAPLFAVLRDRAERRPDGSYTVKLLDNEDKALKKLIEEAGEVALAVKNRDRANLVWELADVLYHLAVIMVAQGVAPADVNAELVRRAGERR